MFNVGDVVKWKSHAGGCWKKKVGRVIAIVPVLSSVKACIPPGAGWRMKKQAAGRARKHVSYLVNPEGYGIELLWPVVSGLSLVWSLVLAPAAPAAAPAEPDDGMAKCAGCGSRLFKCDLDADGLCFECLEKQEKAIEKYKHFNDSTQTSPQKP
jgi:hypothetical protein